MLCRPTASVSTGKFAVRELIAALLAYQQGDLTTPDDFLTASDTGIRRRQP